MQMRRVNREGTCTATAGTDSPQSGAKTQRLVDAHFEAASDFWTEVYEREDVVALICQRRHDVALAWIDELRLPAQARILEVGCGSGLTAVELARKGFHVEATDTVPEMLELTRRRAEAAAVGRRLRTTLSDAHAIGFDTETFDAAIALGVIPWLHTPQIAAREIARVLKPGAHLIVTANNADRLTYLMDPKYNLALRPLRKAAKRLLSRVGIQFRGGGAPSRLHTVREFDTLLGVAGLQTVTGFTLGFGPFTFFGHRLLPTRLELKLHGWLQSAADRGIPGVRSRGAQYLVLARKLADAHN
jgi:ubiquinone/menaquinone biosynthesis C-methylase UbiE